MKKYIQRTTEIIIAPEGEPVFSELATRIKIEDNAGGEYLHIEQQKDCTENMNQIIEIAPEEWLAIRAGIDYMMGEIKP